MQSPSQGWRGDGSPPRPMWNYPPGTLPIGITDEKDRARPLLSACLIVRDEEEQLGACLASLAGLVDEIVVHDTGSVDATVTIAAEHGAVILMGTWGEDFAAARNVGLVACRGRWILHVDADEVLQADPVKLRATLRTTTADALLVEIENVLSGGLGSSRFRATRLFRRGRAEWRGRIHEQVVTVDESKPLVIHDVGPSALILHNGYRAEVITARDKVTRNLRLAELARNEALPSGRATALLDLGRALSVAHRHDEAGQTLLAAAEAASGSRADPTIVRAALRLAIGSALATGDTDLAYTLLPQLRACSQRQGVADLLEGQADLAAGRPTAALTCFAHIQSPASDLVDDDGFGAPVALLAVQRGLALGLLARWDEAADAFRSAVFDHRAIDGNIEALVFSHQRAGRDIRALSLELAVLLGATLPEHLRAAPAHTGDAILECLWDRQGHPAVRSPTRETLLDAAAAVAIHLPFDRALTWSTRLRSSDRAIDCPLLARSRRGDVEPCDRVLAAATACAAFEDPRAIDAIFLAAADVPEAMLGEVLLVLDELAPSSLPAAITGAAATPERTVVVAALLERFGLLEQARALLATP